MPPAAKSMTFSAVDNAKDPKTTSKTKQEKTTKNRLIAKHYLISATLIIQLNPVVSGQSLIATLKHIT